MEGQQQSLQCSSIMVCTVSKFAEHSGMEEGVVIGWIKKGYLPVKRIGKYTLINLALFNQELISDESFGD